MEKREIVLDGRVIPYYLTVNDNKNCYIRVVEGKIEVRAGKRFTKAFIDRTIIDSKDKLLKLIDGYQKSVCFDEQIIRVYGKQYPMQFNQDQKISCKVANDIVYFTGKDYKQTVALYLENTLKVYVTKKVNEYIDTYFDFKVPTIDVKYMKSRWGYCKINGHLCFNISLVHVDKALIDYVVMHELCHFIEQNHSRQFYLEIEKRMPDYKNRIKELKKETI